MKHYRKGEKITNISQLEGKQFIYSMDKVYHYGWWGGWQYRYLKTLIDRGCIWQAIKIEKEEKKNKIKMF